MRSTGLLIVLLVLLSCNDVTKSADNKVAETPVTKPDTTHDAKKSIHSGLENKTISDRISINQPLPNSEISSPLQVEGRARGYWFFEGTAPFEIHDKDHKVLAKSYIEANGAWMTEDFVGFSGRIQFDFSNKKKGYIVFIRANPSGRKENEAEYRLPVLFSQK